MEYGLKITGAQGVTRLDTTDMLARIRYSIVVAAGVSSSTSLPDITGKTVYALSIPLEAQKVAHSVSITGTTLSWTAQSAPYMASGSSLILVIMVD